MESPILQYLRAVHTELKTERGGTPKIIGDYGADIDPDNFAIALTTVDGSVYEVGDSNIEFPIQSISKPLTYGLALSELGFDAVDDKIDVEPSGDAFHEISLSESTGKPANAMINAGAIAVASLIKGSGGKTAIKRIEDHYSAYAGRQLRSSTAMYRAEREHSDRNHALAYLLRSFGIIDGDPTRALETYLRQCAIQVTCRDLSVMGATLANAGTNPITGQDAIDIVAVERMLSVMFTSGMYDDAGDWVTRVGMPAKSGVGGGILAVLPGQAGLAVYSPPLDQHGSSVRGVEACRRISQHMEMHFVRSARAGRSAIRSVTTIDREPSSIRRTDEAKEVLDEHGHRAAVLELAGDLLFAGTESVVRAVSELPDDTSLIVLDLRGIDELSNLAVTMFDTVHEQLAANDRRTVLVDPDDRLQGSALSKHSERFEARDVALAFCEDELLREYGSPEASPDTVSAPDSPAFSMLDAADVQAIVAKMERRIVGDGEILRRMGQRFGGVFFILSGSVDVFATDFEGTRGRVSSLSAGMTFGDLALGADDRQETTAKADGEVEVMVLSPTAIDEIEREDPRLAVQLWRALARHAFFSMDAPARFGAGPL